MTRYTQLHKGITIVLSLALSACTVATPNKAVEIDGKGDQKLSEHEPHHPEARDKTLVRQEDHLEKKVPHTSHAAKDAHETHTAKETKKSAGADSHDAHPTKATHHKEQHKHASLDEKKKHDVFSDEEEDDAALDELEAMTIARTFEKKHSPPWGPPAAVPCQWHEWENDGSCAYTCGGRGKTGQKQSRGKSPPKHGGSPCHGKGSKSVECGIEECPTTTTTTEEDMTTTTAGAPRMADLSCLAFMGLFFFVSHVLRH